MPLYVFKHPKTGEQIEIVQKMDEEHIYIDKNGLKWERMGRFICGFRWMAKSILDLGSARNTKRTQKTFRSANPQT